MNLVLSLPEGNFLLDVFARAIESELEAMFQGDAKVKESLGNLVKSVDVAYAKVQAMANSPLQSVLERLCVNLGGSLQPDPSSSSVNNFIDSSSRRGEGIMGY